MSLAVGRFYLHKQTFKFALLLCGNAQRSMASPKSSKPEMTPTSSHHIAIPHFEHQSDKLLNNS